MTRFMIRTDTDDAGPAHTVGSIGSRPDQLFAFFFIFFLFLSCEANGFARGLKLNEIEHCNLDESKGHCPRAGLEKSAAIRPFATTKSRLASEKILLADSLATESCRLADRLATKLFSKRTTPMRTERDRARSLADVFVGPRCNGSWPFGTVDRVCE